MITLRKLLQIQTGAHDTPDINILFLYTSETFRHSLHSTKLIDLILADLKPAWVAEFSYNREE